uniref:Maturation protein n=1 Tax=Beihai levi-like virus 23 TaxID=1922409 RepID=A0A1L3KHX3_9VIRU|nr:hypothetical protein [Beihai levi-like virus 23]
MVIQPPLQEVLNLRDVVDQHLFGTRYTRFESLAGCHPDKYAKTATFTNGWIKRGRAESKSSDGMRPTAYSAYKSECRQTTDRDIEGINPRTFRAPLCSDAAPGWGYFRWMQDGASTAPSVVSATPYQDTGLLPSVPAALVAKARNKAISDAAGMEVNSAAFMGEIWTSSKMMAETLSRLAKAYKAVKKGNLGHAAVLLGVAKLNGRRLKGHSAHDRWLAFQYGWKPLMSDLYNMHGAITNALSQPDLLRVKATVVETYDVSQKLSSWRRTGSVECGVEIGVCYKVADAKLHAFNQMGLVNPLALAWELMPLSFVVDWFVSVGSFLENLSGHIGLEFSHGYETHFVRSKDLTMVYETHGRLGCVGVYPGFSIDNFAMRRNVLSEAPRPHVAIQPLRNINQVISAAALMKQR